MTTTMVDRFLAAAGRQPRPRAVPGAGPVSGVIGDVGASGPAADLLRALTGVTGFAWGPDLVVRGQYPLPSGGGAHPLRILVESVSGGLVRYHAGRHTFTGVPMTSRTPELLDPADDESVTIVVTAQPERTTARYGDFGYYLICQEAGALLAQAHVVAETYGLRVRERLAFPGDILGPPVFALADLVGDGAHRFRAEAPDQHCRAEPWTGSAAADLHAAGAAPSRPVGPQETIAPASGRTLSLPAVEAVPLYPATGRRRSAAAGFGHDGIAVGALAGILDAASRDLRYVDAYVWVLRVPGIAPGSYRYDPARRELIAGPSWRLLPELLPVRTETDLSLREAAAVVFVVGDPHGDAAWIRCQQIESGAVTHRAALAATSCDLESRIHLDVCDTWSDRLLGLDGRGPRSLAALLVGSAPMRTAARTATGSRP